MLKPSPVTPSVTPSVTTYATDNQLIASECDGLTVLFRKNTERGTSFSMNDSNDDPDTMLIHATTHQNKKAPVEGPVKLNKLKKTHPEAFFYLNEIQLIG